MLDPRLYRATLLPALLALVVAAFSIRQPPPALTATLPPDSFSGARAFSTLEALGREFPSRRPGGDGDNALASRVASELRRGGFRVRDRRFEARTAAGREELRSVVGERAGFSRRQIVVVAHRDSLQRPAPAQLSGTAALIELSRVFQGRTLRKTLVLASTSGGSAGAAGAAEVARHLDTGRVDAVIVLGDVAGLKLRRPMVVPWSNGAELTPVQLQRTLRGALRLEGGLRQPGQPGALAQFARLAFPYTTGEQGQFLSRGLPAVLVSASGERGPGAERAVSPARMGAFGRAALRSISAFDARLGDPPRPRAEIYMAGNVLPAWSVALVSGVLILPVLIVAVDGVARLRRRRHPVGMWMLWVLSAAIPFAGALAFAFVLRFVGLMPTPPPGPAPEGAVPLDAAALAVLGVVGLAAIVGWLALRPLLLRMWGVRGDPGSPGAAGALVLVFALLVAAIWLANPFAAVLLIPALHAWMVVTAPEVRVRRGAALATVSVTLLPVVLVALYYAFSLGYGPLDLVWSLLLFAAGGGAGLSSLLAWCLLAGCLACVLSVIRSQAAFGEAEPVDGRPATRGPATYAGPGSLGGTESALRR